MPQASQSSLVKALSPRAAPPRGRGPERGDAGGAQHVGDARRPAAPRGRSSRSRWRSRGRRRAPSRRRGSSSATHVRHLRRCRHCRARTTEPVALRVLREAPRPAHARARRPPRIRMFIGAPLGLVGPAFMVRARREQGEDAWISSSDARPRANRAGIYRLRDRRCGEAGDRGRVRPGPGARRDRPGHAPRLGPRLFRPEGRRRRARRGHLARHGRAASSVQPRGGHGGDRHRQAHDLSRLVAIPDHRRRRGAGRRSAR